MKLLLQELNRKQSMKSLLNVLRKKHWQTKIILFKAKNWETNLKESDDNRLNARKIGWKFNEKSWKSIGNRSNDGSAAVSWNLLAFFLKFRWKSFLGLLVKGYVFEKNTENKIEESRSEQVLSPTHFRYI